MDITAISRIFSASIIRELARNGHSPLFSRIAKDSSLLEINKPKEPVRNVFDFAFSLLKRKNYQYEYIYKSAIAHKILLGQHSLKTAVMLNEFRVGENKADSVIMNASSVAYEIKSERDSLARLLKQVSSYQKVFAKVNVMTGENHIDAVCKLVPKNIGVLLLTDRFQISTVREAIDSTETTDPGVIFDSIRLSEAKRILKDRGFEIPVLPNTQMYQALRKQFVTLTPSEAHGGMVKVLKNTRSVLALEKFIKKLPHSIQAAALSISLRKQERVKLLSTMNTPVCEAAQWL